jgi:sarcosine oxidase delta subunit
MNCVVDLLWRSSGSLKNRSIDNLETQKKSISMNNSQFFDYLLDAKSPDGLTSALLKHKEGCCFV